MATTTVTFPGAVQRASGELTSDLALLRGWSWPYVAISGAQDGPQTTIIAGIHGCEYVSIYAAMRLARELDPAELSGRVLVVPIVNLPSFWERTPFVGPFDGVNPNRVFPGKATGTFTEQLTYTIFNACIAPANAFIDLHGGDMVEELATFTGYASDAAPKVSAQARAMAEAFGLRFCLAGRERPERPSGLTHMVAARNGVAGVLAEAGGIGQLTMPDVDILVDGTRRALQVAGNLPGTPQAPETLHIARSTAVQAETDGFWICDVRAGDEVAAGQQLGRICDLLGETRVTVAAPHAGWVIYRTTSAAVKQGGLLMSVGVPA